jgi:hypothetical protein
MNLRTLHALVCCATLVGLDAVAPTQSVPSLINYQGRLVNSNNVPLPTGDYELRFSIWDAATNGTMIWGPQTFNGNAGAGYGPKVPVVQGWFNVMLGPVDTNNAPLVGAFSEPERFVQVGIADDPPISPRQHVVSAPFALTSSVAGKAGDASRLEGYSWSDFFGVSSPSAAKVQHAVTADRAVALVGGVTTEGMDLYVATDGLDSNDGRSARTPKRSIQAAVDEVPSRIAHRVEIRVAPGTYREEVRIINKKTIPPQGLLVIVGEGGSSDMVRVSGADAAGLPSRSTCFTLAESSVRIENVTTERALNWGVWLAERASLQASGCRFVSSIQGVELTRFSFANVSDSFVDGCSVAYVVGDGCVLILSGANPNVIQNCGTAVYAQFGGLAVKASPVTLSGNQSGPRTAAGGRLDPSPPWN